MPRSLLASAISVGIVFGSAPVVGAQPVIVEEFTSWLSFAKSPINGMPKQKAWERYAPYVVRVEIPSTADGKSQLALFYAPDTPGPRPLLVVLHSWSETYEQQYGIPYAAWARANDWAFIHPNFRGRFDGPEATCSELAVRDVLDALAYARKHADVDPRRVYLTGFSGGGMMALVLAGRYPQLWTAVAAWVPVFDLEDWYTEVRRKYRHYAAEIRASCGGPPQPGTAAAENCRARSPVNYLERARGWDLPVYLATGIDDPFVSPRHSFRAFNALARAEDRFTDDEVQAFLTAREIPLAQRAGVHDREYDRASRPLLLERRSGKVVLRIFKGRHDVIYNAGLLWLAAQTGATQEPGGDWPAPP